MDNRSLVLGKKEKRAIKRVLIYASEHTVSIRDVKRISEGVIPPVGIAPQYACEIPEGYRVVFCKEEQPAGWCNHLSVSIDDPEALPSVPAVEAIMHEFGMWGTSMDCLSIWIDSKCFEFPNGSLVDAVNLIQVCKE